MTSYVKSGISILEARDRRQDLLERYLAAEYPSTLFVSLNIPGEEKEPEGACVLLSWGIRSLIKSLPAAVNLRKGCDALGPYALMLVDLEGAEVKRRCMEIEDSRPFARLLDMDVYDGKGTQVDRSSLGLPPRPCLVCGLPAVDCIRASRHHLTEVVKKAHELLALL